MKTYQNVRPQYVAPIDLQTLNTAYANLESMHQQAVQTSSELKNAIAQLQLNESEEPFRQQLVKSVEDTISQNMYHDNLAGAYDDIVKLSGDIVSNPALIGRLKAQQEYLKYKAQIESSDIPEQYKENFKKLNPYYYQDFYDESGKITGGSKWEPNRLPVKKVDYNALMTKALQYITPSQNSTEVARFMKEDDSFTTKLEPGVKAVWYDAVTTQTTEITQDEINKALDAAIKADPGALASLRQDFEMAKMDHDKGVTPIHKVFNGTRTYTFNEFVDNIFSSMPKAKAQKNVSTSRELNKNFYKDYATVFGGDGEETPGITLSGLKTTQNAPLVEISDVSGIKAIYGSRNANTTLRNTFKEITGKELPNGVDISDRTSFINHLNSLGDSLDTRTYNALVAEYNKLYTLNEEDIYNTELMEDDGVNLIAIAATKVRADILSGVTYDKDSPDYVPPANAAEKLERDRWISFQNQFYPYNSDKMKIVFHQDKSKKAFEEYLNINCPEIFLPQENSNVKAIEYEKDGIIINKEHFSKYVFQLGKAIEKANDSTNMFQRNVDMGYIDDNGKFIDYTYSAADNSIGIGKGNYESKQLAKQISNFDYGLKSRSGQASMGGGESMYLQAMSAPGGNVVDMLANWEIQDADIMNPDALTHINKMATASGNINEKVLYEALISEPSQSMMYVVENGNYVKLPASKNQSIKDEIFSNPNISKPNISYEFMWDQMRWMPKITYVDRSTEAKKGKVKAVVYDFGKNSRVEELLNNDPTLSANRDLNISKKNRKPLKVASHYNSDLSIFSKPTPAGDFVIYHKDNPEEPINIIYNGDETGYDALMQLRTIQSQLNDFLEAGYIPSLEDTETYFNAYVQYMTIISGGTLGLQRLKEMFTTESGIDFNI